MLASAALPFHSRHMSAKKKRRLQQLIEEERQHLAARRHRHWSLAAVALAACTVVAVAWPARKPATTTAPLVSSRPTNVEKWSLSTLLTLQPHQLAGHDIALLNLLCTEGLRGSEKLDVDKPSTASTRESINGQTLYARPKSLIHYTNQTNCDGSKFTEPNTQTDYQRQHNPNQ